MRAISTTAFLMGAALAASGCVTTTMQAQCDRECLLGVADSYIAAVVANDPAQAPIAGDLVTVENVTRITPGEGLWETATAADDDFAILVPDPIAQAVGYLGVMTVDDAPVVVAMRLQLEDGAIVEAEHLVTGAITNEGALANLETPRPGLLAEVPADQRLRRDQLVSIAGTYYDALEGDSGSLSPFADDCERRENGMRTAYAGDWENIDPSELGYFSAVGCARQLDTGSWATSTGWITAASLPPTR